MDLRDKLIGINFKDGTHTFVWLDKIQTIQEMFEFINRFSSWLNLELPIQHRVIQAWQDMHEKPHEVVFETIRNSYPLTIWFTSQYKPDEQVVWVELSARLEQ